MLTPLHDRIQVIGVFTQQGFWPKKFKWQNKVFLISRITLVSDTQDGSVRLRWYSAEVGANVYRLQRQLDTDQWWIEAVYTDD